MEGAKVFGVFRLARVDLTSFSVQLRGSQWCLLLQRCLFGAPGSFSGSQLDEVREIRYLLSRRTHW